MDAREVRFAVIGTGFGAKMIPIIQQVSGCSVVAVVGRNAQKTAQIAEEHSVSKHYTDFESVLCDPTVDAVYLATPNDTHTQLTVLAAEHGKHVIVEKPMAKTLRDCVTMINVCVRNGVMLMPAYMLRFHPQHVKIRDMIAKGALGTIVYARMQCAFDYPPNGNWRQTLADEGPLWDLASHAVDLTRFLFGKEVSYVTSKKFSRKYTYEAGDSAQLTVKLDDGALVMIDVSFAVPHSKGRLEIYVTEGSLYETDVISQGMQGLVRIQTRSGEQVISIPEDPYANMFEYFAHCIRSGEQPSVVITEDGFAATKILYIAQHR